MTMPRAGVRLSRPADQLQPRFAALVAEEEAIIAEVRASIARLHEIGETVANMDTAILQRLASVATTSPDAEHRRAAEVANEVLAIERRHRELEGLQSRWRAKAVALIEASFDSREPLERFQRGLPASWPNPRIAELEQDLRQFEHEHNKLSALHDQLDLYEGPRVEAPTSNTQAGAPSKPWWGVVREAFLERMGATVAIGVLLVAALVLGWVLPALGIDLDLIEAVRGLLGHEFVSGEKA